MTRKLTMELDGEAARLVVRQLAVRYAMAEIDIELHPRAANAPWLWAQKPRADYLKPLARTSAACKRALKSVLDPLPELVLPEWRPYTTNRGHYPANYLPGKAKAAAQAYADLVIQKLGV